MAAGLGTRLRPFTEMDPKPLLPVMGIPMAQFAVDALVRAGVTKIVANVHHQPEKARKGLAALDRGGASFEISDESAQLLGSAGGMRHALPLLGDGPFFLVNGDVLCDVDLRELARVHQRLRALHGVVMTLTIFPRPPVEGKYAELVVKNDLIAEWRPPTAGKPFFVGAAVIEPEALAHLPDHTPLEFVPEVLKPAIASRRAGAFVTNGVWHDIGDPRLWLKTHLSLMDALETGRLSREWRRRIESANKRVAQRVWISRSEPTPRISDWVAPAYWGGGAPAPEKLGPNSVVYGGAMRETENSIRYGGASHFSGQ